MDRVIAWLAVATSVVAVLAGLDRWMLPTIRQRQYALLTQMRDDEKDPARQTTLDHARTAAAAVQLGAFWVPSVRMWHFPAVSVAVVLLMFLTGFAPGDIGWVAVTTLAGAVAAFASALYGYLAYVRRMAFVRQYLQVGALGKPSVRLTKGRVGVLFGWALMLAGVPVCVGLIASGSSASTAVDGLLFGVALAGTGLLIYTSNYLIMVEREFIDPA